MRTKKKYLDILGGRYVLRAEDIPGEYGHINFQEKIIYYNPKNNKTSEDLIKTIIHEMVHAMCAELSLDQTTFNPEIEEIVADVISKILWRNFRITFRYCQDEKQKV